MPNIGPLEDRPPMIEVKDLHKSFGDHQVLRGVDLTVREGTTMVVLGGSGSGKTVLMKHMIGLLRPDSGQVIVDGEDVVPLDDRQLDRVRRKFGMVFQAAALFDSMTVFENVAFPLREHSESNEKQIADIVHQKLEVVGLKDIDNKFPAELSGGMRKRVGLARAIALDPKIVLYDEPTTGLDPITTDYVDDMILQAQKKLGVTSVVISHDIASSFHIGDEIAYLEEGTIAACGPPAVLRRATHPGLVRFLESWMDKR